MIVNMSNVEEIWEDIQNYEEKYQISSLGRIKSLSRVVYSNNKKIYTKKEKILTPKISQKGYLEIALWKNNIPTFYFIHRLLYRAFKGELTSNMVVDHIDNNPLNNNLDNLQEISYRLNNSKDKWRYKRQSKLIGVTKKGNNYLATTKINGKSFHIGSFNTEEEASEAYRIICNDKSKIYEYKHKTKFKSKGISFIEERNKFKAYGTVNGKTKHLGYFLTEEEAYQRVLEFKKQKK